MYTSIDEIKSAHIAAADGNWFAKDAMRFFNSRIGGVVFPGEDGTYFVSSEKFNDESRRYYTVRFISNHDASMIETVGEFQAHDTLDKAYRQARFYAKNGRDSQ